MTEDEARTILLEDSLRQSYFTIEFLHGCLTDRTYSYAYPEQTASHLSDIEQLIGPIETFCMHGIHKPDCEGCRRHAEWMQRRHEAKEVLGLSHVTGDEPDTSRQAP